MKLKNKLIPLAVVATTASAIAPLTLASCGYGNISVTDINSVEAAKPKFKQRNSSPTILVTKGEQAAYQAELATREYVAWAKEDPSRFVDDLRWGVYQNFLSTYDNSNFIANYTPTGSEVSYKYGSYNSKVKSLKFGASTPEFGTTELVLPTQGTKPIVQQAYTVSLKVEIEAEIYAKSFMITGVEGDTILSTTAESTYKAKTEVEYKNMIFYAFPGQRDDKVKIWAGSQELGDELEVTPQPGVPEVEVNKPGWFITMCDYEGAPKLYDYYSSKNWGVSYNTTFTGTVTQQTNDALPKVTNISGNMSNEATSRKELAAFFGQKNYKNESSLSNWFTQSPMQLVATSVVMDTMSHYLSNTLAVPTIHTEGELNGYKSLVNVSDITEESPVLKSSANLNGWRYDPSTAFEDEHNPYIEWDTTRGYPQAPLLTFTFDEQLQTEEGKPYLDIPLIFEKDNWFYDWVTYMLDVQLIEKLDNIYDPDKAVKVLRIYPTPDKNKERFTEGSYQYYIPFSGGDWLHSCSVQLGSDKTLAILPAFPDPSYLNSFSHLLNLLQEELRKTTPNEDWVNLIMNYGLDVVNEDDVEDDGFITAIWPANTVVKGYLQKENADPDVDEDHLEVIMSDVSNTNFYFDKNVNK